MLEQILLLLCVGSASSMAVALWFLSTSRRWVRQRVRA